MLRGCKCIGAPGEIGHPAWPIFDKQWHVNFVKEATRMRFDSIDELAEAFYFGALWAHHTGHLQASLVIQACSCASFFARSVFCGW